MISQYVIPVFIIGRSVVDTDVKYMVETILVVVADPVVFGFVVASYAGPVVLLDSAAVVRESSTLVSDITFVAWGHAIVLFDIGAVVSDTRIVVWFVDAVVRKAGVDTGTDVFETDVVLSLETSGSAVLTVVITVVGWTIAVCETVVVLSKNCIVVLDPVVVGSGNSVVVSGDGVVEFDNFLVVTDVSIVVSGNCVVVLSDGVVVSGNCGVVLDTADVVVFRTTRK